MYLLVTLGGKTTWKKPAVGKESKHQHLWYCGLLERGCLKNLQAGIMVICLLANSHPKKKKKTNQEWLTPVNLLQYQQIFKQMCDKQGLFCGYAIIISHKQRTIPGSQ